MFLFSRDEALLFTRMTSFYHRLHRNIIRRVTDAGMQRNATQRNAMVDPYMAYTPPVVDIGNGSPQENNLP